ncbi:Mn2+/Fe2+ NRAMP family transporter [Microbacterium testaceum]|uniref:hypothetical protein n=1 Tax=Microbacterium TaxID=33882 RepID=UPI00278079B2|nr:MULTISPECIES: hypothetical protein [Microbacterium]MDQ1113978.1 Mn2+/Fe2+ NRAMP family transporter [Microbacterium testaceum]MDR6098916.1 Mn2+/Fe2+ NRAMP family transporter [Microbacterium sp. SORGH_AS_0454]
MTLFLLIFLSIVVGFVTLVLLASAMQNPTGSMVSNDWARALGWIVVAAIIALAAVALVDRLPL